MTENDILYYTHISIYANKYFVSWGIRAGGYYDYITIKTFAPNNFLTFKGTPIECLPRESEWFKRDKKKDMDDLVRNNEDIKSIIPQSTIDKLIEQGRLDKKFRNDFTEKMISDINSSFKLNNKKDIMDAIESKLFVPKRDIWYFDSEISNDRKNWRLRKHPCYGSETETVGSKEAFKNYEDAKEYCDKLNKDRRNDL